MIRLVLIFNALLFPFLLSAQLDSIRILERELGKASGVERISKRITLAELHIKLGNYAEADNLAEGALQLAQNAGNTYYMALAYSRSAKAAMGEQNLRKARKQLWSSVKLLEGNNNYKDLLLDDLNLLRRLARQTARKSELEDVEARIAAIQQSEIKDEKIGVGVASEQKPEVDILGALEATTLQLSKEVNNLSQEREQLRLNLESRKREIEAMSQQQMQQELELALSKNLLDSLTLGRLRDSLLLTQQNMQLKEQTAMLDLQRSQRNFFFALAAIVLLIAAALYTRYRGTQRHNKILELKNQIIQDEQRRSEDLLLNILPAAVAEELKVNGAAQARHYEHATVLFTDFQSFSKIASKLTPEQLVSELDYCFKNFDRIIEKYQLEKIKTIGDAYMCAGGLPRPSAAHPMNVVLAAIEIQRFLREWKLTKIERGEPYFEARLGIHTGPIVAGVVGVKKFAYDIWGDTVNVAARMEASCEVGKINISETTYQMVKDKFRCKYRGKVPAKNMGEIDMYYVEAPVDEAIAVTA